ncbi:MAG: HNH endonuclease [Planctomycetes bacterium]|nr:HNH endonuclease [Planctomycetota bacterium]
MRARQHGGSDDAENLALACRRCNARKGQISPPSIRRPRSLRRCSIPEWTRGASTSRSWSIILSA